MDAKEDYFIYKPNFEPGDLAWAKVKGFNWWPSLVCNDPEEKIYIKTDKKKTQYHVQFFDERHLRAWVLAKEIKPFKGSADADFQTPAGTFYSKSKSVITAAAQADKLLDLPRTERLQPGLPNCARMTDSVAEPGSTANGRIRIKNDPDEVEPMTEMDAAGDAPRQTSSSPESILTEMKEEPPEETNGVGGEVAVAVNVKEEEEDDEMNEEHGPYEEEDYSESEMETVSGEKEDKSVAEQAVQKKPGPKSLTQPFEKPGPKSSKKGASREDETPSTSREDVAPVRGTYKVSDVPKHMKSSFVLLSAESIPPEISAEKPLVLTAGTEKTPKTPAGKKSKTSKASTGKRSSTTKGGKAKSKTARTGSLEINEEDGEQAGGRRKSKSKVSYKEDESDFEDIDMDFGEEELIDSDEDPGWKPSKKKGGGLKGGKRKRGARGSDEEDLGEEEDSELESDFEEEVGSRKKKQPARRKSKTVSIPGQRKSGSKDPVVEEETLSFQPTVGDYLIEKKSVKDGVVPTIWLFKKGGIIQKYNRIEENGEVVYESAQWFSDWWDDYVDKYDVVKTQVKLKVQNKVKVIVTEWPEDMASWEKPGSGDGSAGKTQAATTSENKENKIPAKRKESSENTNDSEVSSTTTHGDEEFQIGRFVIDKKELKNIDNFSIWKIESGILLKKYEMHIVQGKMMHKPVKVYRGYRDIGDYYKPVKIKRVVDLMSDYVEVEEASRPKLIYDESMEQEAENNPLLTHFYVYLQVLLSKALEPGFLEEVYKNKEDTYMVPIAEIDKLVKQKMDQIERKLRWNTAVKSALQKCPFLREVHKPVDNSVCEGLQDTDETVEETIFLFGDKYDKDTLKLSRGSEGSQEFKIGKTAAKNVSNYHQLCHFKYNLYDKCQAKIKLVQESKYGAPSIEDTMDACLHNKAWVIQNFKDLIELIQT